jgi:hypothetical protein
MHYLKKSILPSGKFGNFNALINPCKSMAAHADDVVMSKKFCQHFSAATAGGLAWLLV